MRFSFQTAILAAALCALAAFPGAARAQNALTVLTEEARPTLQASYDALAALADFDHASVEAALREALVDGLGLKPKLAFGPVRVAVTGRRISPPLFESIELLGRERTLARLQAALA